MAPQQNSKENSSKKRKRPKKSTAAQIVNEESSIANPKESSSVSGSDNVGSDSKCCDIDDLNSKEHVDDSSDALKETDKSDTLTEQVNRLSCDNTVVNNCDKAVSKQVNIKMEENGDNKSVKCTKSREEIMAEREAKKAAKLAAKKAKASGNKEVTAKNLDVVDGCLELRKPIVPIHEVITNNKEKIGADQHPVPLKNSDQSVPAIKPDVGGKSKAELRAERRQKQEAQRAAKAAQIDTAKPTSNEKNHEQPSSKEKTDEILTKEVEKKEAKEVNTDEPRYKVKLFSHLVFEKEMFQDDCSNLHPTVLQLGAQYQSRVISGSNARCLALLHALKKVVSDYSTPLKQEFSRGLESMLVRSMNYLNYCRPASVSMTNAVRHIKRHLTQLPNTIPDSEARQKLHDIIDTYVREQIDVAGEAICNTVQKKINNGDIILTYGCSSLIFRILVESHRSGTKFSVVIVDGGPWFEGREMLRRLVREGIKCTYILITGASFIMREASKVLLGAHALLANGYVMSRAGTSQVALLAHSYNVPVLVCCETHKFSERVQTDAFVCNELGDPDQFVCKATGSIAQWRNYNCLTPLSIAFDVTPPDLVTAVVTELGILPCTSVPVILRIKPSESV